MFPLAILYRVRIIKLTQAVGKHMELVVEIVVAIFPFTAYVGLIWYKCCFLHRLFVIPIHGFGAPLLLFVWSSF